MKVGLVGFPGSGKTTVFNAMTGQDAPVGYGGEVRRAVVDVPDPRVEWLSALYRPKKTTFASIVFCDIPGEHGSEQRGLSTAALQQVRDQDALCLVLRGFDNPALEHAPDPAAELEAFHAECVLADLVFVERWLERARKEAKRGLEVAAFERMQETLESERPLRVLPESELDRSLLRGYSLVTDAPLLAVLNREEDDGGEALPDDLAESRSDELDAPLPEEREDPLPGELKQALVRMGAGGMSLSASLEAEIAMLEPADQREFLRDMGLAEPALDRFIRAAYQLQDLMSFFTVAGPEVRAWTIRAGTDARRAAGKIHSDMERGFIRAEVIPFDVLEEYGSEQAVKAAGRLRVEGRDYVVQDGDVLRVLFNV
ncbi:MAG: redox-regulated ATPase YchF [Gammaproteobacteria bacterium]|nr:redox-regulated ATPase YchF [Gammaproteobacteria bacterium]MYC51195.1 redox-regulated ATPase YchF [Gammaproteobacteria bacterium]